MREQADGGLGNEGKIARQHRDVPALLALFRLVAIDRHRQIVMNEVNSVDVHLSLKARIGASGFATESSDRRVSELMSTNITPTTHRKLAS